MPQSLSRILVHLVFSTKNRVPVLSDPIREELILYTSGILRNHNCVPLQIGGIEDHVHLLFALSRTMTVADVVKNVKTGSSIWMKEHWPELASFSWQTGYGSFSVGRSEVDMIAIYIQNQKEHHRHLSFEEEYRKLLEEFGVEYDERYFLD